MINVNQIEKTKCKTYAYGYVFIKLPNNIINYIKEETLLDIYPNYYKTKMKMIMIMIYICNVKNYLHV